jgi:hypothetical protein
MLLMLMRLIAGQQGWMVIHKEQAQRHRKPNDGS